MAASDRYRDMQPVLAASNHCFPSTRIVHRAVAPLGAEPALRLYGIVSGVNSH